MLVPLNVSLPVIQSYANTCRTVCVCLCVCVCVCLHAYADQRCGGGRSTINAILHYYQKVHVWYM